MMDLLIVGAYFVLLLAVGWRARGGTADAYWVAARRYGTLPVAASLVATVFGASSTVGIIGLGYSRGLTGAWWSLVGGVALIPFAIFLAGRVRRLEVYTLPDILARAYGPRVALVGAIMIALAWCGVVAAQIVAGALLLGSVLSVDAGLALGLVTTIFVLYTLWGGQLSVIRTDSWQVLLFLGALLGALFLVVRATLGAQGPLAGLPPGHLAFPVSPGFGWYQLLVYYPLIIGMPYLVGPDMYSRVLCARSGKVARDAALLAAAAIIPLSLLLATLGLFLRSLFPGILPESALPTALTQLAPTGLRGIIVVGVLGAVMSSADTTLISASTILSLNVLGPGLGLGEGGRLRLTRILVVVLGLVAWGVASFQRGIIDSLLLAYTVFVGGVALPTLASFWKERLGITSTAALWAVALGGATALLGGVRDGAGLDFLLGGVGRGVLAKFLGPEYSGILPLVVSAMVLLGSGRLRSRPGSPPRS